MKHNNNIRNYLDKKRNQNRKLLSTTAFAGLIIAASNSSFINSSSAVTYTSTHNGKTINTSNLVGKTSNVFGYGIYIANVTGLTFNANDSIVANNNDDYGLYIPNSDNITFNSDVTANNNANHGLYIPNSENVTFNSDVTVNNNDGYGLYIPNSDNTTFNSDVTVNNNANHGFYIANSDNVTFNSDVTANNNSSIDIEAINSNIIFNGNVDCNNSYFRSSTITYNGTLTAGIGIKMGAGSTVKFNGDGATIDSPITAEMANQGNLEFTGATTIKQQIGSGALPLGEVRFSSTDKAKVVSINEDITAQNVHLGGATFKVADGKTIKSTGNATTHLKNTTFDLGTGTTKFSGNVVHDAPAGVITFNTAYDGVNVGRIEQNLGTFNMKNNVNEVVVNLEDNAATLPKVGEVRNVNIFTSTGMAGYTFADDQNVTFNVTHGVATAPHSDLIEWKHAGGTFTNSIKPQLADGVKVDTALESIGFGQGNLNFVGGATINKNIGTSELPLGNVEFTANDPTKIVNLNADITAGKLMLGKATYRPSNNVTLTSVDITTTHLNNPVFDLGTNVLKFSGSVVHDDPNGIITINTTFDGESAGHIEMTQSGDTIDLSNSKNLVINITDAPMTPLPLAGQTREVDMFVENGGVCHKLCVNCKKDQY